jgi:hypothetical protein
MAQVLAAVPVAGLDAVLVAVELVLESGSLSAEHILNVVARLTASELPPSASRRRIIRLNYAARCRGLMKARKAASKKPVLRWIKLSFRRWAKAAKCAAV